MSTIVPKIQATRESRAYGRINTVIVTFGDFEYYVDQSSAHVITVQPSRPLDGIFTGLKGDLLPCTVIDWAKEQLKKEDLNAISANFALRDDVWTPAFLESETSRRHEIAFENC